ncbi:TPT-domain-containing protein [Atractiella rhizophila]|nr:TPT-domain-containing protein [Atractiella rhizophila]
MKTLAFIGGWYLFSTLISVYNKWMFSADHYNFGYPLFVTSLHMLIQFILCSITLSIFSSLRPSTRPSRYDYFTKAAPCGLATGLDVGLSNFSMKTITLSFYTMCKSSVLAFVLLFAFIFRLEKPSWRLTGIIAIITVGVVLMVSRETQFDFGGMAAVLTASALGGLRWSLTQILLDKESMGMNNPFATLFFLAPIMGTVLAVISMFTEGWFTIFANEDAFGTLWKTIQTFALITVPGCLAFCMNVSEFGLIQRTSVVTLSVCGIFKEVGTIVVATIVFGDQLTPINISGLAVTLFGIGLYNYFKYMKLYRDRKGDHIQLRPNADEEAGFLSTGPNRGAYEQVNTSVIFDSENGTRLSMDDHYNASSSSLAGPHHVLESGSESDSEEELDSTTHLHRLRRPSEASDRDLREKLRKDPRLLELEDQERDFERSLQR